MKTKISESILKLIAKETELTFDGCDDSRLFYDNESIRVFAQLMSKKEYSKMEKELSKKEIKGEGYIVSAWNDASGYDYWSKYYDDCNYIQITAYINDLNLVDVNKLKIDCQELHDYYYSHYDNSEQYFNEKARGE